jgi:hypothetical protein
MSVPLISIDRQQSSVYEWFLTYGTKLLHSRFGYDDITSCLKSAGEAAPDNQKTVEIMYRHVHMGTHLVEDLVSNAGQLAKYINDRYTVLVGGTPAN